MNIVLYVNNSEQNKINKSLSNPATFSGVLKEETSIINPVILMEVDNPYNYNYAFIPGFNRYYFISNITSVNNKMWRISLKVDVLESFKNEILASSAIISDTEITGLDKYMAGNVWKSKVKDSTTIINFPNGLLDNGEYILITAGG